MATRSKSARGGNSNSKVAAGKVEEKETTAAVKETEAAVASKGTDSVSNRAPEEAAQETRPAATAPAAGDSAPRRNGKAAGASAAVAAKEARKTVAPKSNGPKSVAVPEPSQNEIQMRAYEIWERNGRQPGNDAQNWDEARAELMRERIETSTAPLRGSSAQAEL